MEGENERRRRRHRATTRARARARALRTWMLGSKIKWLSSRNM